MFKFSDYRAIHRALSRSTAFGAYALALLLTVVGTANLALAATAAGGHRLDQTSATSSLEWAQQKVTGFGGVPLDQFGSAVAIHVAQGSSPIRALVGAPNAESKRGAVDLLGFYADTPGVWRGKGGLFDPDPTDLFSKFGAAVAVSGQLALVGAPGANSDAGVTFVYRRDTSGYHRVAKLAPNSIAFGARFGYSVALYALPSGTVAIVGAPFPSGPGYGRAYVFSDVNGQWTQTAELEPGSSVLSFGSAVAILNTANGPIAFVGSPGDKSGGAVYVFHESNGSWTQTQKLNANDAPVFGQFGSAVVASSNPGTLLFIGAPHAGTAGNPFSSAGAVYVFHSNAGSWSQVQKLTAGDANANSNFGASVSQGGNLAVIGAPGDKYYNNSKGGSAYVFSDSNGTWTQSQKFMASDGRADNYFGASVAVPVDGSNTVLVGAPGDKGGQGAAYFYEGSQISLAVSAPSEVTQGDSYVSEVIVTNSGSATSAPFIVTAAQPAGADYQGLKIVSQGANADCNGGTGKGVTCSFSPISGNGGTAQVNITWKATGAAGSAIKNTASLPRETPPLTAGATTTIASAPPPPPPPPSGGGGGGSFGWLGLAALLGLAFAGAGFRSRRG